MIWAALGWEDLDFNEIWDILLLNRRWREALGEKSGFDSLKECGT